MRSLIWKGIYQKKFNTLWHAFKFIFLHFVAISNAFALMFSPLKSSAFRLRDAKCPDVDLENAYGQSGSPGRSFALLGRASSGRVLLGRAGIYPWTLNTCLLKKTSVEYSDSRGQHPGTLHRVGKTHYFSKGKTLVQRYWKSLQNAQNKFKCASKCVKFFVGRCAFISRIAY